MAIDRKEKTPVLRRTHSYSQIFLPRFANLLMPSTVTHSPNILSIQILLPTPHLNNGPIIKSRSSSKQQQKTQMLDMYIFVACILSFTLSAILTFSSLLSGFFFSFSNLALSLNKNKPLWHQ